MTEQEIEAMLQGMKEQRRNIWITRRKTEQGMTQMTINQGRDGTYLVSDEFGKRMFRKFVFNPENQ